MRKYYWVFIVFLSLISCNNSVENIAEFWLTKPDGTVKLEKQAALIFDKITNNLPNIDINENERGISCRPAFTRLRPTPKW